MTRRRVLLAAAAAGSVPLVACTTQPGMTAGREPIVFVHGNGDTAALWTTTIWRFESNGWPRARLSALDLRYPLARDDDTKPQPGRTSTGEHMAALAAEIRRALAASGAAKVILIGNSRGGNAIRNYVAHWTEDGGGAARVSAVVLGGVPNHGVYADPARNPGSEFNGAGPFLRGLNAPQGPNGDEVAAGIRWATIRSENNDKFAQPDGAWIGQRGVATNVAYDGPALKGATNVVVPGIDHRETSFSARAFAETWMFLTGAPPPASDIVAEPRVVLDGTVSGLGLDNRQGGYATNLPLEGATVEVWETDPQTGERRGAVKHAKAIGADGRWGPFTTVPSATHEFVVTGPAGAGYATTHVYRSPFPRSSSVVSLRADRIADADRAAATAAPTAATAATTTTTKSIVVMSRPRGYYGLSRDRIVLDGAGPPAGIPAGVAGVSTVRATITDRAMRSVVGEFNGERIAGLAWPLDGNHAVLLELTY